MPAPKLSVTVSGGGPKIARLKDLEDGVNAGFKALFSQALELASAGNAFGSVDAGFEATPDGGVFSVPSMDEDGLFDFYKVEDGAAELFGTSADLSKLVALVDLVTEDRVLSKENADASALSVVSAANEADRSELARDAAIDAGNWNYKPNDETALNEITGMVAGETAYVRSTMVVWKYDGSSWGSDGKSPLADKVNITDGFKSSSGKSPAIVDANGVGYLVFDKLARAIFKVAPRVIEDIAVGLGGRLTQYFQSNAPAILDANGISYLAFDKLGRARFAVSPDVANQVSKMIGFDQLLNPEEASRDIVVFGHSVAAAGSGIGPTLAALFPDRNVYTEGIGGQDGLPVFQRQGSQPVSGTFSGNAIPASGSVAITGLILLNGSGSRTIKIEVETAAGDWVEGTLAYTAAGSTYAFTREVEGSVEALNEPANINVLSGMSGVLLSEFDKMIQVWLPFRNDVADGVGDPIDGQFNPQAQMTYLAAAMERVSTNRVVILGDINGAADSDSSIKLRGVERSNKAVKAVYPENFIDIIELCDAYGLTEITTADDGRDYIKITSDFSSDGLHPSDEVGKPVMAQAAKDHIISKGW